MVEIPSINDLLKVAAQFGHKVGKCHPKMKPYIQRIKNGVYIINLEKTQEKLKEALDFVKNLIKDGGIIVFVGTKPVAKEIIKKYAEEVQMPYVNERWLGGTLTNFSTISLVIEKLKRMINEKESGEWEKYTKKEKLNLEKELNRLEKLVGGLKNLDRLPDALYIVDVVREITAVKEAKKKNIPTIGIVDTDGNPDNVSYPIPANDEGLKSIELITSLIVEAIKEGKNK